MSKMLALMIVAFIVFAIVVRAHLATPEERESFKKWFDDGTSWLHAFHPKEWTKKVSSPTGINILIAVGFVIYALVLLGNVAVIFLAPTIQAKAVRQDNPRDFYLMMGGLTAWFALNMALFYPFMKRRGPEVVDWFLCPGRWKLSVVRFIGSFVLLLCIANLSDWANELHLSPTGGLRFVLAFLIASVPVQVILAIFSLVGVAIAASFLVCLLLEGAVLAIFSFCWRLAIHPLGTIQAIAVLVGFVGALAAAIVNYILRNSVNP